MKFRGTTKEKILLLLRVGLVLSLKRTPRGYLKLAKDAHREWQKISRRSLPTSIRELSSAGLVRKQKQRGEEVYLLTKKGERKADLYSLDKLQIAKHEWDGVWRIVMFDIPEKRKKARESLRYHLKNLGFLEYQRSVFIFPFKCRKEIDFISNFYKLDKFIRIVEAQKIDAEAHFLSEFNVS